MLATQRPGPQSQQSLFDSSVLQLARSISSDVDLSDDERAELHQCADDLGYFIENYVYIYDSVVKNWVPFRLWPEQVEVLAELSDAPLAVLLKARQLGWTWLVLAEALHRMLFQPMAAVLIFSRRDEEAVELLDFRLKGMHQHIPATLRIPRTTQMDAKHGWELTNGSRAFAFPTTGGRSYTATHAIIDEADFVPDLGRLLNAVQPTIDAGGQLRLLSTPDKSKPISPFKQIYQAAKVGTNKYRAVFRGWRARPDRDERWYAEQKADILARTGGLDDLHQEYPETDREALSARTLSKRIPALWLENCYREVAPMSEDETLTAPSIPGLLIWRMPRLGDEFVAGADPAEGNPNSDDSSLDVVDKVTGEQVAVLAGKYEPTVFAGYIAAVCKFFNYARVLIERNNHGHLVLACIEVGLLLRGIDNKYGWLTTAASKSRMYDQGADTIRQRDCAIHSEQTYMQLASIEASTLAAPEGMMDDRATSFLLALLARSIKPAVTRQSNYMTGDGYRYEEDEDTEWQHR